MRRLLTTALLVAAMSASAMGIASAQALPPCNDADGDGSPSGLEYAQHHIVPLAQMGELGAGGHIPGRHRGFSACR
ncbi:MAG: hypothetical protein ACRDU8_09265 [Egibacteraceae bacterium]